MDVIAKVAQGGGAVGTVLNATSKLREAAAAGEAGKAARASKEMEANLLERRAGQERAIAQRKGLNELRKERFVQSALQARAAASGGGADPTVAKLASDIAAEGDYRYRSAIYEGDDLAEALRAGAAVRRYEGKEAVRAGNLKKESGRYSAGGTLLGGFDKLSAFAKLFSSST